MSFVKLGNLKNEIYNQISNNLDKDFVIKDTYMPIQIDINLNETSFSKILPQIDKSLIDDVIYLEFWLNPCDIDNTIDEVYFYRSFNAIVFNVAMGSSIYSILDDRNFYPLLIHELVHFLQLQINNLTENHSYWTDEDEIYKKYYNTPSEIDANAWEIFERLNGIFSEYRVRKDERYNHLSKYLTRRNKLKLFNKIYAISKEI